AGLRRFAAVAATVGWTALAIQLYLTLRLTLANGGGIGAGLIVYFSYFTILTNLLVTLALTVPLLSAHAAGGMFFSRPGIITAIAACIALGGIAYALLLQQLWDPKGLQLLADILLHYVMPAAFLIYWWFAVRSGEDRVRWSQVWPWATFYPFVYFLYHTARGAISGVYPYPFVNPTELGYARVMLNALGLLAGILLMSLALVGIARSRRPANSRRDPSDAAVVVAEP
ncbi:MAG: Pr6Pr family membrane protein, partial [Gemmatimonadaceae bacterium]